MIFPKNIHKRRKIQDKIYGISISTRHFNKVVCHKIRDDKKNGEQAREKKVYCHITCLEKLPMR